MSKKFMAIWGSAVLVTIAVITILQLNQPYKYRGSLIETPLTAPEINLPASNGESFHLSDYRGKILLVFFGYTSCPDVCPTTLSEMIKLAEILGDDAANTQVVFITVDPGRDTQDRLAAYLSLFNPLNIGLTGTEEQLAEVWQGYGVYRAVDSTSETATGYLVDHSSRLYLIDQQGNLRLTYAYGTDPVDIAADITNLLNH